ncbi:hypothetical protein KPATCC21470_1878 [Kitasatospora purpeofusca]
MSGRPLAVDLVQERHVERFEVPAALGQEPADMRLPLVQDEAPCPTQGWGTALGLALSSRVAC